MTKLVPNGAVNGTSVGNGMTMFRGVKIQVEGRQALVRYGARALLSSVALAVLAGTALAQDATWLPNPDPAGDFNTGTNWSSGNVPTGTATFGTSTVTDLTFSGPDVVIGGWTFEGTQDYTFVSSSPNVRFTGAGIVVNGGSATIRPAGLYFQNNSTAGSASIIMNAGALGFHDNSSAADSTITAVDATIIFGNGAVSMATAGNSTIASTRGFIVFNGQSTAGDATITAEGTALNFNASSNAGNANITNNGNGFLFFHDNSTAGDARLINNAGGKVDFSKTMGLAGDSQISAGSIAGAGNYYLGARTLTVGGNDDDTEVSGVISDCGASGTDCLAPGTGGSLMKVGTGILTLTGNNTFSGLTTINQGTVSLGNGGTSGSIAGNIVNNNAFLAFNRSDNVTYAGVLSGSGATSFTGTGMTTLTGNSNSLTGPVLVTAGNLRLASGASLGATTLAVGTGGTLSGLGTIAGNVSVEGRLAPGADALGSLTVQGNVDFATGSTYAIRIAGTNPDPWPAAARVDSLSIGSGTADLSGGTVEITAIDPRTSYVDGYTYTNPILSAAGGLGGTEFAGVGMASNSAFITPTLDYTTSAVFLTIAVTQDFTTVAETFNQFQAATGLNDLQQTGDALEVFNTIANMNADDARRAFDQTSGEVHAAGQHVIDQTFALFNRTLRYQGVAGIGAGNVGAETFTAPLGYGPAVARGNAGVVAIDGATDYADARVRGAWAAPLGGFGRIDGDGNAAKLEWWNGGLAGGYEGVIDLGSGNAVGGLGFGYIRSHSSVDDRLSTFDSDGFYLGAYGAWADGPWNVAGSLSYGANRVSTERNIAFMGTTAEASYWTHTIGLSGEASYAFDLADTTTLAPLFTLDAGWSGHGGFTETGAGALNLTSGGESWSRLDTGLGIALTHVILTEAGKVTLEGRAVWEHAFADVVPSQNLAFVGSPTGFTVLGPDAGRDRLRLGAGLTWDVSDDMTLRARYDGLFSSSQADHSASLGLNIRF